MKKLLFALVLMAVLVAPVFGAQVQKEIIDDEINTTTSVYEADLNISDAKRVSFFVNLDNNRTTASVTATVTVAYSLNGTDWTDISWMDVAGGVTPQTTETTTAKKQQYIGWMDNRNIAKYIRVRVNATEIGYNYNSMYTAADHADLKVTICEEK